MGDPTRSSAPDDIALGISGPLKLLHHNKDSGRPVKENQVPLSATPQLSVRSETAGVVLDLAAKVRLHFRGFGDLALTVDNSLRDQLQGACGTFEESGVVRLLLPDGEEAKCVRQFLRVWWAAEFSG